MKELLAGKVASMNFVVPLAPSFSSFAWITFGCLATIVLTPHTRAQPPAWPDAQYIANGCYLSTAVYLAKLREHYPDVTARAETVRLTSGKMHTIAVVEWGHKTYLRDMFIGIASMKGDVQRSFDEALSRWLHNRGQHGRRERNTFTSDERWLEIESAARWIAALRPQVIQVFSGRGPIPVLWWTTARGELALYEPSVGTAVGFTRRAPLEVATELFGRPSASGLESHRSRGE
jgi:hypothetical protein